MKQVSNLKQPPLWLPSNTIIHRIFPPSSSSLWPSDWMHSSDATWEADASSSIIYLFILFFNRLMKGTLCSSFPLIFHQLQVPRFRSGTIFLAGRFRVAVEINHRLLSIIDWTPLMLRQFWLRRPAELMSQVHQMCSCATQTTLCRGRKKKKKSRGGFMVEKKSKFRNGVWRKCRPATVPNHMYLLCIVTCIRRELRPPPVASTRYYFGVQRMFVIVENPPPETISISRSC